MSIYTGGTARWKHAEAWKTFLSSATYESLQNIREAVVKQSEKLLYSKNISKQLQSAVNDACRRDFHIHGSYFYGQEEEKWAEQRAETIKRLDVFLEMESLFGQTPAVLLWVQGEFALLGYGNAEKGLLVFEPEKYLEYVAPRDRSELTPAELKQRLPGNAAPDWGALFPVGSSDALSPASVRHSAEETEAAIASLKSQMEDVQHEKEGELAALRKEIQEKEAALREKKEAMLQALDEKKAGLEIEMQKMSSQLYMLESEIYAIECYLGDTIRFGHIKKGANAPDDVPLVIHQKFRFLDEELGKLASLYEIQWDEMDLFERFLQHHPLAQDTFAPEPRCVTIVRLSKDGITFARNADNPYSNMLETFEYYHGTTVGIIIRNGENLYLGWTEPDKVKLKDDLVLDVSSNVVAPEKKDTPAFENNVDRLRYVKEEMAERKKFADEIVNRAFIFNILQGVIDNTDWLPMPEKVDLSKNSPLVVYSMADRWLSDSRFESFGKILEMFAKEPMRGDAILTTQYLVPERTRTNRMWDRTWENTRGRGERNRTHDCHVEDCKIYPINLVEYDPPVEKIRYEYRYKEPLTGEPRKIINTTDKATADRLDMSSCTILGAFEYREQHVFISVPKTDVKWGYYEGKDPRSNFELYEGEYINLTYLNSVVLEWAINTRTLGGWAIGGKSVTYAFGIKYLNTALQYVREREKKERVLLEEAAPGICSDPDWPLRLSEWKKAHSVREITPYQAKRFVKEYSASKI